MYLISIITVILGIGLLNLFSGDPISGVTYFLDAVSFVMLGILTVPMLISSGLVKDFNNAFRLSMSKNKISSMGEVKRAIEAVNLVMKVVLVAGVFIATCLFVIMLHELDAPETLGPKTAIAILSLVYALAINLFLLPLKSRLKMRLQDYMEEE